jgi:uncharacterized phage infection (PIP) family protein YhgE
MECAASSKTQLWEAGNVRNRYLILGLSAFLAVALTVPALGGPSNPIADGAASAKKTAKKALKKAKKANKAAKAAQSSADAAQLSADGAQSTADGAQSAAEAAQTSADTAQASADAAQSTADSKYGSMTNVEGTTSPTNNAAKGVVFATCPSGRDLAGGGYIVNGAGNDDARVTFNTAYLDAWGVVAGDQGIEGGTWDVTPTARCIGP